MSITRRQFLKWAGVAGLSAVLPPFFDRDMVAFAELPPGVGYFLPTSSQYTMCKTCDSNCSLIMRIKDGVVRELNGNPADELGGQGKICVKGQSAMRHIYDPDILKSPMKRTNSSKGINQDPGFVVITWAEAYTTIANKMKAAKDASGAKSIVVLERPTEVPRHLLDSLGTPNQICHTDTCYLDHEASWYATFGKGKTRTFETEKATYILSFGYDIPGKSKMAQLRSFLTALDNGAKVVVFDPRNSTTASMADEWFAIKPGTDLAVALAMIYVIINNNLYDATYVENYCSGFAELKTHIIDTNAYTPEWAEGFSGIPADEIRRIAREFAASDHPLIPMYKRDPSGPVYSNSFSLNRALVTLNVLVGAIESTGGFWFPRTPATAPSLKTYAPTLTVYPTVDGQVRVDGQHMFPHINTCLGQSGGSGTTYGYKSKGSFGHLADGLERSRTETTFPDGTASYPVKVILSNTYNVMSFPKKDHLITELCNSDIFIAAADNVVSCLCWLADIVLPTTWFPEDKDNFGTTDQHEIWGRFFLMDGIGPVWPDRKGTGGIYKGLLEKLREVGYWGDPALPATPSYNVDFGALAKERMKQFAIDKGIGTTFENMRDWLRANNGIWQNKVRPPDYQKLSANMIKLYASKFDLSENLSYLGEKHDRLPTWHPKIATPDSSDKFYFVTNHSPYHRMNKNSNDPLIMDLQPENFLYIHPDAAENVPGGPVVTGDYVNVKGETGLTLKMRVKVIEGIRPDTVMTEHGYGHFSKSLSVAYGKGVYDGDLMVDRTVGHTLEHFAYEAGYGCAIGDTVVQILAKA